MAMSLAAEEEVGSADSEDLQGVLRQMIEKIARLTGSSKVEDLQRGPGEEDHQAAVQMAEIVLVVASQAVQATSETSQRITVAYWEACEAGSTKRLMR